MSTLNELITLGLQNEYDLEHDSEYKTLFSKPKIYDGKGDLSKRWYVYFSYLDPKTGKLKRLKNIYGKANRFKNKENRYALLSLYRKQLLKLLNEGYNPFNDNTALYQQKKAQISTVNLTESTSHSHMEMANTSNSEANVQTFNNDNLDTDFLEEPSLKIKEAFELAIELKTNVVNQRTLNDYENRCNLFQIWLKKHHNQIIRIAEIDKKIVSQFLNGIQLKTSSRNRNNYRGCFSSIFQIFEDNEIISKNFIKAIKPLKTIPKRNKTYSEKEQTDIFTHLEKSDTILLLFIKFISYNFLRPIEVCRLKVKDIDMETRTLQFQAKNKALKTKIIPEILIKELPDLSLIDGDLFLFTPHKIGGP